jgi:hypothetical protein
MVSREVQERFDSALKELWALSPGRTDGTADARTSSPDAGHSLITVPRTDKTDESLRSVTDGWEVDEVIGEMSRPRSGAGINFRLFRAGEIPRENAVEWIACAILCQRGESFKGWRWHAPAVEAALNQLLRCEDEECS